MKRTSMKRKFGLSLLLLILSEATQAACTLAASGVAFGVYNPTSATATDASGTVTLNCGLLSNLSGAYTISLSIGGGTSYSTRRMHSGLVLLPYQLYRDAAHTQIWGNGTAGSFAVAGTSLVPLLGGTAVYFVYGRITAHQLASPGTYTDVIIATITY